MTIDPMTIPCPFCEEIIIERSDEDFVTCEVCEGKREKCMNCGRSPRAAASFEPDPDIGRVRKRTPGSGR